MQEVEYKIVRLTSKLSEQIQRLEHLNQTEGWELVTIHRDNPSQSFPKGRIFAYLKKPLD